jgi:Tfp pilus assembly protein PilN
LIASIYIGLIVATLIFSIYNGYHLFNYIAKSKALKSKITQHNSEIRKAEMKLDRILRQIKQKKQKKQEAEIIFINTLIDRRTFSWCEMLSICEKLLPPKVMMLSISPKMEEKGIVIELSVASDNYEELLEFINNLEKSPHFSDVFPLRELNEQYETDMITLQVEAGYHP